MSVPILSIKAKLDFGDQTRIAKELKCSRKQVSLVLNGERGARETQLQTRIIELATKIGVLNIEKRKELNSQAIEA